MEKLIDAKEAADVLGVEVNTLDKWRRERCIPFLKIQGAVRFSPSALQKWIQEHEFPVASAPAGRSMADLLVDQSGRMVILNGTGKKSPKESE
jgi:excisionase family DNA binding protein